MKFAWFAAVAVIGAVLDLVTKAMVFEQWMLGQRSAVVEGILYIETSTNKGAAFGMFPGQTAFFIVVSILAMGAMLYFVAQAKAGQRMLPVTLGLLLAGVMGNFYDRMVFGEVRDFIAVRCDYEPVRGWLMSVFGTNQWPNFNVADSCICVGAALVVILFWLEERAHARAETAEAGEVAGEGLDSPPKPASPQAEISSR